MKQGLVQSLSVYIDTLLICTCSAMMVHGVLRAGPRGRRWRSNGMPLVQMAVNNSVGEVGIHFITFAIFAFAFSSLIGNYFYAESNFRYITKNTQAALFVVPRPVPGCSSATAAVNSFDLAWNLADIFMGFMAIVNLVAILLLGKWALGRAGRLHPVSARLGKDPVFIGLPACPGMPAVRVLDRLRICRTSATIRWRSTSRKPHRSTRRA